MDPSFGGESTNNSNVGLDANSSLNEHFKVEETPIETDSARNVQINQFTGKHLKLLRSNNNVASQEIQDAHDQLKKLTNQMDVVLEVSHSARKTRTPPKVQNRLAPSRSSNGPSSDLAASRTSSVVTLESEDFLSHDKNKEDDHLRFEVQRLKSQLTTARNTINEKEQCCRELKLLFDHSKEELNTVKSLLRQMQNRLRRNDKAHLDTTTKLVDEIKYRDQQIVSLRNQLTALQNRALNRSMSNFQPSSSLLLDDTLSPSSLLLKKEGKTFGRDRSTSNLGRSASQNTKKKISTKEEKQRELDEILKGAESLLGSADMKFSLVSEKGTDSTFFNEANLNDEFIEKQDENSLDDLNFSFVKYDEENPSKHSSNVPVASSITTRVKSTRISPRNSTEPQQGKSVQSQSRNSVLTQPRFFNQVSKPDEEILDSWDKFAELASSLPKTAKDLALHAQRLSEKTLKQHIFQPDNSDPRTSTMIQHILPLPVHQNQVESAAQKEEGRTSAANFHVTPSITLNTQPLPYSDSRPVSRSFSLIANSGNEYEAVKRDSTLQTATDVLNQLRGFRKSIEMSSAPHFGTHEN
eukprot:GDKJ01022466.1.p1 GENE.GDKJ01022466.1~~GDKJ01022466.1.p1  ORF type:complete len:615 (+),score=145.54 GDKJ01022466.1:104-1846(+)